MARIGEDNCHHYSVKDYRIWGVMVDDDDDRGWFEFSTKVFRPIGVVWSERVNKQQRPKHSRSIGPRVNSALDGVTTGSSFRLFLAVFFLFSIVRLAGEGSVGRKMVDVMSFG